MIQIQLPENLKEVVSSDMRLTITSDETWAFTEHPKIENGANIPARISAHDLFSLFTASIIRGNYVFTR